MKMTTYFTGYRRCPVGNGTSFRRTHDLRAKQDWRHWKRPADIHQYLKSEAVVAGLRDHEMRDTTAPPGVIRYRSLVEGTGQPESEPVYMVREITYHPVIGPKGRLP